MNDLISREAAIDELIEDIDWERDNHSPLTSVDALRLAIQRLKKLPAVDALPVRHGKWIYREDDLTYWWECSICSDYESKKLPYCPSCGAKMDEEVAISENTEECSSRIWINDRNHGKV